MNKQAEASDIQEFYNNLLPYLDSENAKLAADRAYGYKGEKILIRNLGIINDGLDNNNIN